MKSKDIIKIKDIDNVAVAVTHPYGCGVAINAPMAEIPIRAVTNVIRHPNFGGEIMAVGLGCAAPPASDIVCGPSQVASGIGLQVFMTGREPLSGESGAVPSWFPGNRVFSEAMDGCPRCGPDGILPAGPGWRAAERACGAPGSEPDRRRTSGDGTPAPAGIRPAAGTYDRDPQEREERACGGKCRCIGYPAFGAGTGGNRSGISRTGS